MPTPYARQSSASYQQNTMMTAELPTSHHKRLDDIANARLGVEGAEPFGGFVDEPGPGDRLFHLAPCVCIEGRGGRAAAHGRSDIMEVRNGLP